AAALRAMLNRPRKVLKAPESTARPAAARAGRKGSKADKKAAKAEGVTTRDDSAGRKKPASKPEPSPTGGRDGWRSGPRGRGGRGRGRHQHQAQQERREPQVTEFIAREIHVPETIT